MLILSGEAEAVADGDGQARYRSESSSINVPAVVRLKHLVKIAYRPTCPLPGLGAIPACGVAIY